MVNLEAESTCTGVERTSRIVKLFDFLGNFAMMVPI